MCSSAIIEIIAANVPAIIEIIRRESGVTPAPVTSPTIAAVPNKLVAELLTNLSQLTNIQVDTTLVGSELDQNDTLTTTILTKPTHGRPHLSDDRAASVRLNTKIAS